MSWPREAYLEERALELAPASIASYRWALRDAERRIPKALEDLTRRDLLELARAWRHNDALLSALRTFLRWTGSPLASAVPHGIRPDSRQRLVWYTLAEVEEAALACRTPRERLVLHLALELMMRRVELERCRLDWFRETHVEILGKGRHGGKVRRIPYHPYTRTILQTFISASSQSSSTETSPETPSFSADAGSGRSTMAATMRTPGTSRSRLPSLLGLRKSALDKELKAIGARAGVHLMFHALRRTGGRLFVQAGIAAGKAPLEVLNELRGIYGHEDLRTTMRYIGWEIENAGITMALMPSLETRTQPLDAIPASGPSGISSRSRRPIPPTS